MFWYSWSIFNVEKFINKLEKLLLIRRLDLFLAIAGFSRF